MGNEKKIRLLIVDDHPVVRDGFCAILGRQPEMIVVGAVGDGRAAVEQFRQCQPDVTLMDLRLPVLEGVEAIQEIRAIDPTARILVVTTYLEDQAVYRAVQAGASGYLLKDARREELVEAVRAVASYKTVFPSRVASVLASNVNRPPLTRRETEVVKLISGGKANKEIARLLGISEGTVKVHVRHVLEKLNASSRTEAARVALTTGLVRLE